MDDSIHDYHPVVVPQDNVSDEHYVLVSWSASSGEVVTEGQVLGEFETSKSIFELPARNEGTFYPIASEGQQVVVGQVVAVLANHQLTDGDLGEIVTQVGSPQGFATDHPESAVDGQPDATGPQDHADRDIHFSLGAQQLIEQHEIDRSRFAGMSLVRRRDVERLLQTAATPLTEESSPPPVVRGSSLVIVGAGGHARMLLDLILELRSFQLVGLLDDGVPVGTALGRHRVIGPATPHELAKLHQDGLRLAVNAVGGVSDRRARRTIWERLRRAGYGFPTLIHPSATIDASATIAEGAQVLAGAYVGANAVIGENCIINTGAVVSHDCTIGSHVHVAPGAMLAGGVTVGDDALVGMAATVYIGVTVGAGAIINNGVAVYSEVAPNSVARRSGQQS